MTICIAAACVERIDNSLQRKVVVCFDSKVSSDIWSSETEFKFEHLAPAPFLALLANDVSEARELIRTYRANPPDATENLARIQEQLRTPLRIRKRSKIESLVHRRLGISYDQFLSPGLCIPKRGEVADDIDTLTIDVDLILIGFIAEPPDTGPQIFQMELEEIKHRENFACIGWGSSIAEQMLHMREQSNLSDLESTLYNVYEAKKMGEIAPSAGPTTHMGILESSTDKPGFKVRSITGDGLEILKNYYQEYGPKEIEGAIKIPREAFKEVLFE